jgi:phosphoribosylformylglycinamidine (FGAM) synthase-like amidotransferase family enzyme
MTIDWFKPIRWWGYQEGDARDTFWLQKQILIKRYQDKKQNQSYKNQVDKNHSQVRIPSIKNVNSNLISFVPKKATIRKIIEEAKKVRQRIK